MARPKFTIKDKTDKRNFLKYLENNKDKVLSDITSKTDFVAFWELMTSPTYILDTPIDKYFEDLTTLLYMLPETTISKIKITLRARRKTATAKGKVQMTIDKQTHSDLSAFALANEGLSLSAAIDLLLSKASE